jgi:arylsulfatase
MLPLSRRWRAKSQMTAASGRRANVVLAQYHHWRIENAYLMGEMIFHAAAFLETFKQYPPSQRPASFSIDQVRKDVGNAIDQSFKVRGIEK